MPYAGGVVVAFMIVFSLWVRSVPPATPKANAFFDLPQSRPEDDPALKEALKGAEEALNLAQEMKAEVPVDEDAAAASEIIEL
jgi:hypothetical protein